MQTDTRNPSDNLSERGVCWIFALIFMNLPKLDKKYIRDYYFKPVKNDSIKRPQSNDGLDYFFDIQLIAFWQLKVTHTMQHQDYTESDDYFVGNDSWHASAERQIKHQKLKQRSATLRPFGWCFALRPES